MKKLLLLLLFPTIIFSQISVKTDTENNNIVVTPKLDSLNDISKYKSSSQFLGLIGAKLYGIPTNKNNTLLSIFKAWNVKVKTKQKVKTLYGDYKVGEYMPIYDLESYQKNIENKYFVVNKIVFFEGLSEKKETSPEIWQINYNKSTSKNLRNIDIFMKNSEENIEVILSLEGGEEPTRDFISVPYYENLAKKFNGKSFLFNELKNYKLKDLEYYKNSIISEPEKINEDDIYNVESVSFIQDKYNSKYQLELYVLLKNKKGTDLKIPVKDDYSIIGPNSLVELKKYKNDYDYIMIEKAKVIAERNNTIYKIYGKKIGDKIIAGEIELGMDTLAIMYILGKPDDINTTITNSVKEEQYVYKYSFGTHYYYFKNNKLVTIQK